MKPVKTAIKRAYVAKPHPRPGDKNHPKHLSKKFQKTIVINRPADDIYNFIINIDKFITFIKQLESARHYDVERLRRLAENPPPQGIPYFQITSSREHHLVSWRAENADVDCAGSIQMHAGLESTEVTLTFAYNPPVGAFVNAPAQIEDALEHFKEYLEAGKG